MAKYAYPVILTVEKARNAVMDEISFFFPDLPGCFSSGHSIAEAIAHAKESLLLHLTDLLADGAPLPVASKPLTMTKRSDQTIVMITVHVDAPKAKA